MRLEFPFYFTFGWFVELRLHQILNNIVLPFIINLRFCSEANMSGSVVFAHLVRVGLLLSKSLLVEGQKCFFFFLGKVGCLANLQKFF